MPKRHGGWYGDSARHAEAARQGAANRRSRLQNKAKIQYTRAKALEVLDIERGIKVGTQSHEKAYHKWAQFHYASLGVKPVGKRNRFLSHAMAAAAAKSQHNA